MSRNGKSGVGMAIIWISAVSVVVVGFASFAVDYGRVVLAKSELEAAATAAARAGAANLPNGVTAVQNAAVAIASRNNICGAPLQLDVNKDIIFGHWDELQRKFTPVGGAARGSATAVQIDARRTKTRGNPIQLLLGRVVGKGEVDVVATAIARTTPVNFPFVGLEGVTFSGQGNTDSYDSRTGAYSNSNSRNNGHVASNGDIIVGGSGTVAGEAHPGINKAVLISGQGNVSGSKTPLSYKLQYATPTVPDNAMYVGAVSVGNGNYYVPPGDYHCTSFSINNKATFWCQGPVRIFVSGPVNIAGGYVNTYQNRPQNFQIYVTNASPVSLTGQAGFYGQIFAPLSEITQGGQADIYGTLVGRTLSFGGTWKGGAHADESITNLGTGVIVTTR